MGIDPDVLDVIDDLQAQIDALGTPDALDRPFIIFDEIIFDNRPADLGLRPLEEIYGQNYPWYNGDRTQLPDLDLVRQMGADHAAAGVTAVSHDLETFYGDPNQRDYYIQISEAYNEGFGLDNHRVMHYNVPWIDPLYAVREEYDPGYISWAAGLQEWAGLWPHINAYSPAFYTKIKSWKQWDWVVRAGVKELRKLSPAYPVYPHISMTGLDVTFDGDVYVPGDFFRFQLETLYEIADGVIIWGGNGRDWTTEGSLKPWWDETQKFRDRLTWREAERPPYFDRISTADNLFEQGAVKPMDPATWDPNYSQGSRVVVPSSIFGQGGALRVSGRGKTARSAFKVNLAPNTTYVTGFHCDHIYDYPQGNVLNLYNIPPGLTGQRHIPDLKVGWNETEFTTADDVSTAPYFRIGSGVDNFYSGDFTHSYPFCLQV